MTTLEAGVMGEVVLPYSARVALQKRASVAGLRQRIRARMNKTAAKGSFLSMIERNIPRALETAGLAAAAGLGTEIALRGYEGLKAAVQKSSAFKKVVVGNPDLAEIDSVQLKEQFNTLYRFSPTVARSPLLAASWLRQVNQHIIEGRAFITPDTVKGLVDIEKGLSETRANKPLRSIAQTFVSGLAGARDRGSVRATVKPSALLAAAKKLQAQSGKSR